MEFFSLDKLFNKRISFANYVTVVLIPTREEYLILGDLLWWKKTDYILFRNSAAYEMQTMTKRFPSMTCKQVLKMLYQPNNICYDESNCV